MIHDWVTDCLQNHTFCQQIETSRQRFTPDRLIQLESPDGIFLSVDHPDTVDYLALSYCWGGKQIFSTTHDNFVNHHTHIPWAMVPDTFRQAIKITHQLGYKYIWIDALCVIQGDIEDFTNQCKKMGDIYTNAVMVISADSGHSVHTGFLAPRENASIMVRIPPWKRGRPKEINRTFSFDVKHSSHIRPVSDGLRTRISYEVDQVFVRPQFMNSKGYRDDHDSFWSAPTFDRGWCFQEQRLASRILHFNEHEMYWECGSRTTCECGTLEETQDSGDEGPILLARHLNGASRAPNAIQFWWSMIEEFSSRKFTVATDRLPALSGLAHKMQNTRLGKYYAGLWEHDLLTSLLWQTDSEGYDQGFPSKTYVGPTWSWISIMEGRIRRPRFLNKRKITSKIERIEYYPSSNDAFGAISSASISLTGDTKSVALQLTLQAYFGDDQRQSAKLRFDDSSLANIHLDLPMEHDQDASCAPHAIEVLCLIISHSIIVMQTRQLYHWQGLVLARSTKQTGAFERIGIFGIEGKRGLGWRRKTVMII
ncbi:heterokaryon incompatibility protein-domain-containing protein [Xylariaceae sp. FL1272]|nr:heterokaryon incompatibility protein-domain-containing protein [Xylariaceae sp. FL1272]